MAQGWHKQKRRHKIAAYKGIVIAGNLKFKNSSPADEFSDYKKLRPVIKERRAIFGELNEPELNRYEHFQLPSNQRIEGIKMKFEHMPLVKPIEVKTKKGELKVVDFYGSSRGWGGQYTYDTQEIIIDKRLMDKADWSLRKGTIAHEYQHSVDMSEQTPSAINNIVRQTLIQNFPKTVVVGAFPELLRISRRLHKPIKKSFHKDPAGGTIILYSLTHNKKKYAFGKDTVWVSESKLKKLSERHNKQIKSVLIGGKRYQYIPFRFANVFKSK